MEERPEWVSTHSEIDWLGGGRQRVDPNLSQSVQYSVQVAHSDETTFLQFNTCSHCLDFEAVLDLLEVFALTVAKSKEQP